MTINGDFKLIKEKKINKSIRLIVSKNIMSGRIFVEFTLDSPKLVLQKNYQNDTDGKRLSEEFARSIKSVDQFKNYFGIKNKEKTND